MSREQVKFIFLSSFHVGKLLAPLLEALMLAN